MTLGSLTPPNLPVTGPEQLQRRPRSPSSPRGGVARSLWTYTPSAKNDKPHPAFDRHAGSAHRSELSAHRRTHRSATSLREESLKRQPKRMVFIGTTATRWKRRPRSRYQAAPTCAPQAPLRPGRPRYFHQLVTARIAGGGLRSPRHRSSAKPRDAHNPPKCSPPSESTTQTRREVAEVETRRRHRLHPAQCR